MKNYTFSQTRLVGMTQLVPYSVLEINWNPINGVGHVMTVIYIQFGLLYLLLLLKLSSWYLVPA